MGIGAKIAQRMFRAAEGSLGVDDPVMKEQQPEPGCEASRFSEWDEMAVELEPAFAERCLEPGNKLTAEDTAEHLDGKKEGGAGGDPVGVVWSESAGSKYTVNMGMMLQTLVPGMEHAEEADLRAEVTGIAGDLQQSCSTGVKQQVVDQLTAVQISWD